MQVCEPDFDIVPIPDLEADRLPPRPNPRRARGLPGEHGFRCGNDAMSGTFCSSPGTETSNGRAGRDRRLAVGLGVLLAVLVGFLAWMEACTWRQVTRLERNFAEVQPGDFVVGLRLEATVEALGTALLRFRLSNDPREREMFHQLARELGNRLDRTSWRTAPESVAASEVRRALQAFLQQAVPLLEEGVRGVRRDTAAEEHRRIEALLAPLLAVARDVGTAQAGGAAEFFAGAQHSLSEVRQWLVVSLVFCGLVVGGIAALAYRLLVAPLKAQLTETEAAVERKERLASLGTLATGLAHEIRNPLAALKLRLFSLKKSLPPELAGQEDLGVLNGELQRLERIVKNFLQFARPPDPVSRRMDVEPLLRSLEGLLDGHLRKRGINLEVEPGDGLVVHGDADQLRQVLLNLVQNAADAIGRDGTITVSARIGVARLSKAPEPVVILGVADTGPGIGPEVGARMFDPFFSTKEGGTGLGLPIAARILENHGGCLQYATRRGAGSVFSLVLPRPSSDASEPAPHRG